MKIGPKMQALVDVELEPLHDLATNMLEIELVDKNGFMIPYPDKNLYAIRIEKHSKDKQFNDDEKKLFATLAKEFGLDHGSVAYITISFGVAYVVNRSEAEVWYRHNMREHLDAFGVKIMEKDLDGNGLSAIDGPYSTLEIMKV